MSVWSRHHVILLPRFAVNTQLPKAIVWRAAEMSQKWRAHIALPEVLSLVPSTHAGQLITACNSYLGGIEYPVLASECACTCMHTPTLRHGHTHNFLLKKVFLKRHLESEILSLSLYGFIKIVHKALYWKGGAHQEQRERVQFYVNITQARVIWEEETRLRKCFPKIGL